MCPAEVGQIAMTHHVTFRHLTIDIQYIIIIIILFILNIDDREYCASKMLYACAVMILRLRSMSRTNKQLEPDLASPRSQTVTTIRIQPLRTGPSAGHQRQSRRGVGAPGVRECVCVQTVTRCGMKRPTTAPLTTDGKHRVTAEL